MTTDIEVILPEFDINATSSPKIILKRQAAAISNKARNIIECEITTEMEYHGSMPSYLHCFVFVLPLLNYQRVTAFYISQPLVDDYPLTIYSNFWESSSICNNKEELIGCLNQIFAKEEFVKLINSLVAQSS
jgi:hypothetical protein